jgi:tetratricopeptide (TPR) repeat protein
LPRYRLASLLEQLGEFAAARALFEAIAGGASDATLKGGAAYHLGQLKIREGLFKEAYTWFECCLRNIPGHNKALQRMLFCDARVREAHGDLEGALQAYRKAYAADPSWALGAYNLASLLVRCGKAEEALELFGTLLRPGTEPYLRAGVRFHQAQLLLEQGQKEKAKTHLEQCLRENSAHKRARELLDYLRQTLPDGTAQ